ncbi:hypothetical protein SDC9_07453 [bioreactor metagenome]|uniref:Uncharacterized protein n=1 Tax=bioreactor metagenome TaxID=1076179 RepID=A0A644T4X4_9ZZZZ|nr:hypothetical protein [Methanobrevibacter sp.]MEA4956909.1 hypothetical protein [Methanobrevibacter sp.]
MSSVIFDGKYLKLQKVENRRYAEFKTNNIKHISTAEEINSLISELEVYKHDIKDNKEVEE